MSISQTTSELYRKRKRRNIEYLLMIALCGYGSGAMFASAPFIPTFIVCGVALLTGWNLSVRRERRRLLPASDMTRAFAELIELLCGVAFIIVLYVVLLISSVTTQTYVTIMLMGLMCYLTATYFAEQYWAYRRFIHQPIAHQLNYIVNLSESVIKPLSRSSMKHIKHGFTSYFNS